MDLQPIKAALKEAPPWPWRVVGENYALNKTQAGEVQP